MVSPTNEFTTVLKNGSKRDEKKVSKFYVSVRRKDGSRVEGGKKGKKVCFRLLERGGVLF